MKHIFMTASRTGRYCYLAWLHSNVHKCADLMHPLKIDGVIDSLFSILFRLMGRALRRVLYPPSLFLGSPRRVLLLSVDLSLDLATRLVTGRDLLGEPSRFPPSDLRDSIHSRRSGWRRLEVKKMWWRGAYKHVHYVPPVFVFILTLNFSIPHQHKYPAIFQLVTMLWSSFLHAQH